MPDEEQGDDMKPLPKPKATPTALGWLVHYPGTYSKFSYSLRAAYLDWMHSNWTRSRIMRTV